MESKTLRDVKCGETAVVAKLNGDGAHKRRIMDMGITKGTEIFVRKVAPMGIPLKYGLEAMSSLCVRVMPPTLLCSKYTSSMDSRKADLELVQTNWRRRQ